MISGVLCKRIDRKIPNGRCVDQTNEFLRSQGEVFAFVTWAPKTKRKGQALYEVYDLENHKLLQSPPGKLELEPDHLRSVDWKIPVANLATGIYRVDVLLDGEPAWRSFFRIAD